MELTKQQEDIINYDYQKGDSIIINAFAGTGKTSTLVELAQKFKTEKPRWRCLYMVYNSGTKAEAEKKFVGTNVECRTSGSLVFQKFSRPYGRMSNLRLGDIKNALNVGWSDCSILKRTVESFIGSADEVIHDAHVPNEARGSNNDKIIYNTQRLWSMMIDTNNRRVPVTFDGSIKLAQLDKKFRFTDEQGMPFDVIFFDECQDANPATLGIVENQKKQIRIFVGDKHQQIYQFRGSINAIKSITPTKEFSLTTSFRFGDKIADCANVLLDILYEKQQITGFRKEDYLCDITDFPHAFIARTNAQLFEYAITIMKMGKSIHFVGGITGYRLSDISDIYNLKNGNSHLVQNEYIKKTFKNYYNFESYIEKTEDPEFKSIHKTVKLHDAKIPILIEEMKKCNTLSHKASVCLMTAHKSKGAEFDRVRLANDYIKFVDEKSGRLREKEELRGDTRNIAELNLLYVAMTRAKKQLDVPNDFKRLLESEDIMYTVPETLENLMV
jgi:F-box protein, helicase, 18